MGCMKTFGCFHITSEPGQGQDRLLPHCSGPGPCSFLGPGCAKCECTISVIKMCYSLISVNAVIERQTDFMLKRVNEERKK